MKQLTESTWVLEGPTNIGFIEKHNEVVLVDSGNDKESGRKINKILKDRNWRLKSIINTHSNADHIGGNDYLQRNLKCEIYASHVENVFVECPQLETAFLWGGLEVKDIRNKFFQAKPSKVTKIIEEDAQIEDGLKSIRLKGHYFNMIGIKTSDKVSFIADSLFGEEILKKYKIPFIYEVEEYKRTIEQLINDDSDYYVPSHGPIVKDIKNMAGINLNLVEEIEKRLEFILEEERTFDQILKRICDDFKIDLNIGQYALVGSTIRSFLSYLYDEKKIAYKIENNLMSWKQNLV